VIRPAELIERKRDGGELSAEEIRELVLGYTVGEIPEYQVAAFLMAVYFKGLNGPETSRSPTRCSRRARRSSSQGDRPPVRRQALDRRCRRQDVDRSRPDRRRLRRSVREDERPGARPHRWDTRQARVDPRLPARADDRRVHRAGARDRLAIIGQSANLCPADKKLYALRDVTATVDNVSLIAASIMSKKLAGGADAIVLDVKVGDGAFMKTLGDARALAETMIELGERAGRKVVCMLTDMDQPLGQAVGNALEIREALDTIQGKGPADFQELVLASVAHLLALSDLGIDELEGRTRAEDAVADGAALAAYERWIRAQGGDPDPARSRSRLSSEKWRRSRPGS
jgi:pyrimidine-nucleoside phosphorylase